jgi:hypothetical protein
VIKKQPLEIWEEYQKGMEYNQTVDLYTNVEMNENFYIGRQWEGVNAPNIEKPVINVLRQAVDYYVSMLVSDDISVQCQLPDDSEDETRQAVEYIVSQEIDLVFERTKFKSEGRDFIKNVAVDGDAYMYWRFNKDLNKDLPVTGGIELETLDNTNVIFGNPAQRKVQKQPYILVVMKLPLDEVREMAKKNGVDPMKIIEDNSDYDMSAMSAQAVTNYATVLTKLYKENGTVKAIQCTRTEMLKPVTELGLMRYPIASMVWRKVKNAYHGESPLTSQRQNQIMINKYYMMINEWLKKVAFPKILYDANKILNWTNKVEAIGVNGDPNLAVATSSPIMEISQQVNQYAENLIQKTKETMGVYDVALGNAKPDNTSAIIALQKTASQPLELQKMDYYQMVEDSVYIILEIMSVTYGVRPVTIKVQMTPEEVQMAQMMKAQEDGVDPMMAGTLPNPIPDGMVPVQIDFDYADLKPEKLNILVEIGASAYWSELMQIQSLDNMFRAGIIPDPITYIEQLPNGIVRSKKDLIKANEKAKAEAQAMAQQQAMMMPPQKGPTNG